LSERCNEVLAEIERFVDGELPDDRLADLVEHIHECPPCLYRADFQAKLKEILRTKCRAKASAPPESFVLRVRRTIRAEVRFDDRA
jgi:anti-sigma factor (TIGR02949 family)